MNSVLFFPTDREYSVGVVNAYQLFGEMVTRNGNLLSSHFSDFTYKTFIEACL